MSGGITQLVATGAQDTHLVGQPEISFWQSSYKRHTNFSSVIERQVIVNTPASGGISSVRFERKGDLLSYCYLTSTDTSDNAYAAKWNEVIDKVELYIGGQLIDTQTFEFSTKVYTDVMAPSFSRTVQGSSAVEGVNNYVYPLKFWFGENWQSALPLVALQYHDVEMRIYWGTAVNKQYEDFIRAYNLYVSSYNSAVATILASGTYSPTISDAKTRLRDLANTASGLASVGQNLATAITAAGGATPSVEAESGLLSSGGLNDTPFVTDNGGGNWYVNAIGYDYTPTILSPIQTLTARKIEMWSRFVYLDTAERRSFADRTSDYLIQQVQRIPSPESSRAELTFNHPCKFLATTSTNVDNTVRVLLQLNGTDVGDSIHAYPHYRQVSSYWHTQFGHNETTASDGFKYVTLMIPFCLDASKLQPTGTVNFSRIDSARLILNKSTFNAPIYAVNYNILRVQNGMAGVLYAN